MKKLFLPVVILIVMLSECISSDSETSGEDINNLLINEKDLPEGYQIDSSINYSHPVSNTMKSYGYVEEAHADYIKNIITDSSQSWSRISQSVMRLDKTKTLAYLDNCASFIENWYCGSDETNSIVYEEHEQIGDMSLVATVTTTCISENDGAIRENTLYYVVFVEKDIAITLQAGEVDDELYLNVLINIARLISHKI